MGQQLNHICLYAEYCVSSKQNSSQMDKINNQINEIIRGMIHNNEESFSVNSFNPMAQVKRI